MSPFHLPPLFALISQHADPKEQGAVFGLNQGLGSLARVIGPFVAGWIFTRHHTGPFVAASILILLAMMWMIWLRQGAKPAAAAPVRADSA